MTTTPGYPDPNDRSRQRPGDPGWPTGQSPTPGYGGAPYQSQPYQSQPYQSQPYQSQPYQSQPYESQPYRAQPYQPDPYQSQPYPTGQSGYGQPPGYPPRGGPGGRRPGTVTAAAVLAFVVAGLSLLTGLVALLAGGAVLRYTGLEDLAVVIGLVFLVIGGLFVWGGVWAVSGRNGMMLTIVAGLTAILQMFALFQGGTQNSNVAGLAISIVIIVLMLVTPSREWYRSRGKLTF